VKGCRGIYLGSQFLIQQCLNFIKTTKGDVLNIFKIQRIRVIDIEEIFHSKI